MFYTIGILVDIWRISEVVESQSAILHMEKSNFRNAFLTKAIDSAPSRPLFKGAITCAFLK